MVWAFAIFTRVNPTTPRRKQSADPTDDDDDYRGATDSDDFSFYDSDDDPVPSYGYDIDDGFVFDDDDQFSFGDSSSDSDGETHVVITGRVYGSWHNPRIWKPDGSRAMSCRVKNVWHVWRVVS